MINVSKLMVLLLPLSLAACASPQHYAHGSNAVLVKPTIEVWLKPGATEEERYRVESECAKEMNSNEQLRKSSDDIWSEAARACMARSGFVHRRDKNRRAK